MALALKLNDSHRRIATLIRRHQPVSRAELGRLAGLGSGPVTQITRDLLLSGLVREGERIRGGRGQPALPLMLNPAGTLSFGVAMIPGRLRVVAIDFAGEVVHESIAASTDNSPEAAVSVVDEQIELICRKLRLLERDRILGVGFALPGFFFADHKHVRVVDEHASWRQDDLCKLFSTALDLPCWIENDATAAAMAEYYRQQTAPRALITLLINYGIGSGMVLEGRPYRGARGNAGEIGAFFPLDKPRPSGTDLLKLMQERKISIASLDEVDVADPRHDAACVAWAQRAGAQLRELINAAWSWFDPETIILSGALPRPVLECLISAIDAPGLFALHPDRPEPRIRASTMGATVAAIGAAHVPLHAFTSEI